MDAGKGFHWAVMLDSDGEVLLSRRVENEEADLSALVEEALGFGLALTWSTDQPGGTVAMLLALLWKRDQPVLYVPGIAVDRARDASHGESKTDARDAHLIAQQARMRRDLSSLVPGDELLAELALLVARRRDLVTDRTRTITRLRDALLALFPGLERALDLGDKGPLLLVERYQTPHTIRKAGRNRVEAYLKKCSVRGAAKLAEKAVVATKGQSVSLPAEGVAAGIVAALAREALLLKERIVEVDRELELRFLAHPLAEILVSLPGMRTLLAAELLVAVGDPRNAFADAGRLAAYVGLVPADRDSGKRTGNNRRMRGGNKMLKRVFYQSAFASLRTPASRAFYDRKRAEGKRHTQALIALARRRVDVLWAMIRDEQRFRPAAA
ncbi:MAG: IS110 family transposase [Actinobacteria bacterium]|nr:MAG: IS110 family transposase [Actinomycetota bacterium]